MVISLGFECGSVEQESFPWLGQFWGLQGLNSFFVFLQKTCALSWRTTQVRPLGLGYNLPFPGACVELAGIWGYDFSFPRANVGICQDWGS